MERKFNPFRKLGGILPSRISTERKADLEAEIQAGACFTRLVAHEDWPAMESLLTQMRMAALDHLAKGDPKQPLTESERIAFSAVAATCDNIRLSITSTIKKGEIAQGELERITKRQQKEQVRG